MSGSGDLETRVEALEVEVARLREDGAATRAIAALADRDVAEVRTTNRATRQVLTALRETQIEQGQALHTIAGAVAGLTTQVAALDTKADDLAEGQARHDQALAAQDARLDQLTALVTTLAEGQTEILRRLPDPPDET